MSGKRLARHAWKPLPALRKSAFLPSSCGRLLVEEAGEAAPDELIGQALLAGAGGAGGAQGRGVGLADVGGVVAGAAHRRGEVAAEAAADVAEDEAVVAGVQAVREAPVEAREARLHAGAGRVLRRRAAGGGRGGGGEVGALRRLASTAAAPSAAVSRQRRTLCRNACTRVT